MFPFDIIGCVHCILFIEVILEKGLDLDLTLQSRSLSI